MLLRGGQWQWQLNFIFIIRFLSFQHFKPDKVKLILPIPHATGFLVLESTREKL